MQIIGYRNDDSMVAIDIGGVESPDVGQVLAAAIKTHSHIVTWRVEPDADDDGKEVTP